MPKPQKIHIIGGPGSGKSFMAQKISEQLGYAHTDLDDLCWNADFSQKTDLGTRKERLAEVLRADQWIVEGAYCADWLYPAFESSDVVLSLQTNSLVQKFRLAKRLGGRAVHGALELASSAALLNWVDGFEATLDNFPEEFTAKVLPIVGKAGANAYLAGLSIPD